MRSRNHARGKTREVKKSYPSSDFLHFNSQNSYQERNPPKHINRNKHRSFMSCSSNFSHNHQQLLSIAAMKTMRIFLCIDSKQKNDTKNNEKQFIFHQKNSKQSVNDDSTLYLSPYKHIFNWHIFKYDEIYDSNSSFICDIFENVIQPLFDSFLTQKKSSCLALYSPKS